MTQAPVVRPHPFQAGRPHRPRRVRWCCGRPPSSAGRRSCSARCTWAFEPVRRRPCCRRRRPHPPPSSSRPPHLPPRSPPPRQSTYAAAAPPPAPAPVPPAGSRRAGRAQAHCETGQSRSGRTARGASAGHGGRSRRRRRRGRHAPQDGAGQDRRAPPRSGARRLEAGGHQLRELADGARRAAPSGAGLRAAEPARRRASGLRGAAQSLRHQPRRRRRHLSCWRSWCCAASGPTAKRPRGRSMAKSPTSFRRAAGPRWRCPGRQRSRTRRSCGCSTPTCRHRSRRRS